MLCFPLYHDIEDQQNEACRKHLNTGIACDWNHKQRKTENRIKAQHGDRTKSLPIDYPTSNFFFIFTGLGLQCFETLVSASPNNSLADLS